MMMRPTARIQRGAATLAVTLVLFFVMTLLAAFANRNHVFEQRSSANQYRATQAFEAAEAGAEWALAMLNDPRRVDDDCLPGGGPQSFRERHLPYDASSASRTPATWDDDGEVLPLQAACVRGASGWTCSCPAAAHPSLGVPSGDDPAPAFVVQFSAGPHAGVVHLLSTGCTSLGGACVADAAAPTDAVARVRVTLGLVPALATPPVAALTVKGSVQAGAAPLGLHNADVASGGVAVHAGGAVSAANVQLTTVPGAAAADAVVEGDASLAASTAEQLFASLFGVDKSAWRDQPAVTRVVCSDECGAALAATVAAQHRLVWVDGDLEMEGPLAIGTREQPVIIVASGALRLHGDIVVHGLLYGTSLEWNDTAGGGLLRGAAVSQTQYTGNGAPHLFYDAAVLARLHHEHGSFARVPGSWKDF